MNSNSDHAQQTASNRTAAVAAGGRAGYRKPKTSDDLTAKNVATVIELEREVKEARSRADRFVDAITEFSGSISFVWAHVIWFGGWIAFDLIRRNAGFDPYPFQLLTLIVSLEAIILSALILISQNRDARVSDRRNHLALQIALLSEQENTKMLQLLDKICKKLDINDLDDPTLAVLEEATRPERLVEQIDTALDSSASPASEN